MAPKKKTEEEEIPDEEIEEEEALEADEEEAAEGAAEEGGASEPATKKLRSSTGGADKPGPTALLFTPGGRPDATVAEVLEVVNAFKDKSFCWDGVRDVPSNNIVKKMKKGDIACFAHASTVASERAVIGGLEVLCDPKPDPTQFDVESPYFDPAAAKSGKAKWMCVEVKMVTEMAIPVPIAELESKSGGPMAKVMPEQHKVLSTAPRQCAFPIPAAEWGLLFKVGQEGPEALKGGVEPAAVEQALQQAQQAVKAGA